MQNILFYFELIYSQYIHTKKRTYIYPYDDNYICGLE